MYSKLQFAVGVQQTEVCCPNKKPQINTHSRALTCGLGGSTNFSLLHSFSKQKFAGLGYCRTSCRGCFGLRGGGGGCGASNSTGGTASCSIRSRSGAFRRNS